MSVSVPSKLNTAPPSPLPAVPDESDPVPPAPLQAILSAHPATGEIYENMNYEISGLSRSPLERSVATEMLATQLLHKFTQAAPRG